jgi:hypothetical protein
MARVEVGLGGSLIAEGLPEDSKKEVHELTSKRRDDRESGLGFICSRNLAPAF